MPSDLHVPLQALFQSWAPSVTHVLAARGSQQAVAHAAAGRDVLDPAWLHECAAAGVALPLRPWHYCHMGAGTAAAALEDLFEARCVG